MGRSHVPVTLGSYTYTFFEKGWIDINGMSISYYSIEHILEDLYTQTLQGALFMKFRKLITGCKHIDTLQMGPLSTKKRVGNIDEV